MKNYRRMMIISFLVATSAFGQSTTDQRIAEAVLPLPDALKAGAAVIAYDEDGEPDVLRKGTNDWICEADDPAPGIFVRCHHVDLKPFRKRQRELLDKGFTGESMGPILADEIRSGDLEMPDYSVEFFLRGDSRMGALPWTVVWIPLATAESTGLLTEPDAYRPWLMRAGQGNAHIMFPGK